KLPPPGPLPSWVDWDEEAKQFVLVPGAASAIQLIYRWAAEGLGIDRIVAKLHADGVPPIGKTGGWRVSYGAKLLSRRGVLGDLTVKGGQTIAGFYPAAVTPEEWNVARGALSKRRVGQRGVGRRGEAVANLLAGLATDARDGETMHLHQHAAIYSKNGKKR